MIQPEPEILWSGLTQSNDFGANALVPCRLVRRWDELLKPKVDDKPKPRYVVEVAPSRDAMDAPVWKPVDAGKLPREFFASIFPEPGLVAQSPLVDRRDRP